MDRTDLSEPICEQDREFLEGVRERREPAVSGRAVRSAMAALQAAQDTFTRGSPLSRGRTATGTPVLRTLLILGSWPRASRRTTRLLLGDRAYRATITPSGQLTADSFRSTSDLSARSASCDWANISCSSAAGSAALRAKRVGSSSRVRLKRVVDGPSAKNA